jgi:hypothetical protein
MLSRGGPTFIRQQIFGDQIEDVRLAPVREHRGVMFGLRSTSRGGKGRFFLWEELFFIPKPS